MLLILMDDIRWLVHKEVERQIKRQLDDRDQTISSHAQSRRTALKLWMKSKTPLAWDIDGNPGANYARLSLILCNDPNLQDPTLPLTKKPITYDTLGHLLVNFVKAGISRQRCAPLTKDGGFQFVLPIAYEMIKKHIPLGNNTAEYWLRHLIG